MTGSAAAARSGAALLARGDRPAVQRTRARGTFGSLRWGGLAALRRKDIGLAACAIRVERQLTEMPGGYAYGAPKSCASVRTVSIPSLIMPRIRWHLSHYTGQDADALVFTSPAGRPVRHGHFRRRVWLPALRGFRASASLGACA